MWHLRRLMAEHGMFATTDLVPLLAARGVCLSREQVCRLVTGTPERLSLNTLAALCGILGCGPGDLVEPVASGGGTAGLVAVRVRGLRARSGRGGPRSCPARAGRREGERAGDLPGRAPGQFRRRLFPLPPGRCRGSGRCGRPVARRWPDRRGR